MKCCLYIIISCMHHFLYLFYEWYHKSQQRKPFQGPFQIPDILPLIAWGHWCWWSMMAWSHVRMGPHIFLILKIISTTKCKFSDLFWPATVHEHVSYKSEYSVMGPCVVIVRSWNLMVRTWVLWWGHPILMFMCTGLSTLVLLIPQKEVRIRDTIENKWKWRGDLVMIYYTTVHS